MADPSIRLYFPGGKAGSFGTLAAGFKHAFEKLGLKHACLNYRQSPDEDGFDAEGADYDIGLYVGEPTHLSIMCNHTGHKERLVMVAPNGYGIPGNYFADVRKYGCTMIAPSRWAASVLEEQADDGQKIEVLPHGVQVWGADTVSDDLWAASAMNFARMVEAGERPLDLLHVTSTASDRKGTLSLLRAWEAGDLVESCRLTIKCDELIEPQIRVLTRCLSKKAQDDGRLFVDATVYENRPWDAPPSLATMYANSQLLVQPSAAEGFSLGPLEAAACGVPSLLGYLTGESTYQGDIEWLQALGRERGFIRGEEFEGHPPAVDEIVRMIRIARGDIVGITERALAKAATVRQKWSWENVVRNWLDSRRT